MSADAVLTQARQEERRVWRGPLWAVIAVSATSALISWVASSPAGLGVTILGAIFAGAIGQGVLRPTLPLLGTVDRLVVVTSRYPSGDSFSVELYRAHSKVGWVLLSGALLEQLREKLAAEHPQLRVEASERTPGGAF